MGSNANAVHREPWNKQGQDRRPEGAIQAQGHLGAPSPPPEGGGTDLHRGRDARDLRDVAGGGGGGLACGAGDAALGAAVMLSMPRSATHGAQC